MLVVGVFPLKFSVVQTLLQVIGGYGELIKNPGVREELKEHWSV